MLSFEDRLLQLERLERWCCKATPYQQLRVTLPLGLLLGIVAALPAVLAPYPTPDETCQIITAEIKVQVGAFLLPADFSACPLPEQDQATRSPVFYPSREGVKSSATPNLGGTSPPYRVLRFTAIHFPLMRGRPDALEP